MSYQQRRLRLVAFGTALSVGATLLFVLQTVGIIPYYLLPVNLYGKTFDIATVTLVLLGLLFPSRGAVEMVGGGRHPR